MQSCRLPDRMPALDRVVAPHRRSRQLNRASGICRRGPFLRLAEREEGEDRARELLLLVRWCCQALPCRSYRLHRAAPAVGDGATVSSSLPESKSSSACDRWTTVANSPSGELPD